MKLKVVIKKVAEGHYIAHCPTLPGCAVEANSETNARQLLKAAINAYVISHKQRNEKLPIQSQ
jgi:predicted RNase H-like HicB family nuclease